MPAVRVTKPLSAVTPFKRAVLKHRLTLKDKLDVLDFCDANENSGMSQEDIAHLLRTRGYGTVHQSSISRWRKNRESLKARAKNPNELRFKRIRQVEFPDVDQALRTWVLQALSSKTRVTLTGHAIRSQARVFAAAFGHSADFMSLSNGWLESFKQRMGLRQYHFHGEAASAPVETLEAEIQRIRTIMDEYAPRDQLNFDETALYYCLAPDKGLAVVQMSGIKTLRVRITVGICTNADGSERFPLMFIGYARRPRPFRGKDGVDLGYQYWFNETAWMREKIWNSWLANLNDTMAQQGRKVLLLVDNAPSHIHKPELYPNVRVEFFAPNLTAWIQPNDAGIIQSFKSNYRREFILKTIERANNGEQNIYKINQLEAMELATTAWNRVMPSTVVNCWRHTKLSGPKVDPDCPPSTHTPPTLVSDVGQSVAELQQSLDALHARENLVLIGDPMRAEEFLAADADVPTEQILSDDEIVDEVKRQMQDADTESQSFGLEEDETVRKTAGQISTTIQTAQTRDDVLSSLQGLRDFISGSNMPEFDSDLAALVRIEQKLSKLNNM
ncbi:DDE superfamily endonuclease [Ceratobasidium sp. AG-Ba]|nr:DDE superfamily endonuclease [Ceratobasidium sp. AG-Ba]